MRKLLLLAICTVAPASGAALAQSQSPLSDPLPRFERAGGGFACVMNPADFSPDAADAPCMRLGPLTTGMPRTDIEQMLGPPAESVRSGGHDYFLHGLQSDSTGLFTTYVLISYAAAGGIDSIQLTGLPWPGAWRFSGITLGDPQQSVIERLGEPKQTQPSGDPGGTM